MRSFGWGTYQVEATRGSPRNLYPLLVLDLGACFLFAQEATNLPPLPLPWVEPSSSHGNKANPFFLCHFWALCHSGLQGCLTEGSLYKMASGGSTLTFLTAGYL